MDPQFTDVFGYISGLMNQEAQTKLLNAEAQDYGVLAQERALNVQARQQQQADEMQFRKTMMDTMQGNNPPQFRGGAMVDVGDPLVSGLATEMQRDQQSAANARQLSDAMRGKVSLTYQDKLDKDAREADRVAVTTATAFRQAQSDLGKRIGSMAGSAKDESSFRSAYQDIAGLNPQLVRSLNWDRDTNGIPTFGPQSQKSMQALQYQGMTAAEQIQKDVNVANEARKEDDDQRKLADENRKQADTDSLVAYRKVQSDLDRAREAKLKDDEARAKRKEANLQLAAAKPATNPMKDSARASITATDEFKDAKFDNTLEAFTSDVADRANRIRADAARDGEDMGLDEARQQAISELKANVKKESTGWFGMGADKYTYGRGGSAPKPTVSGTAPATAPPKNADQYLESIGIKTK